VGPKSLAERTAEADDDALDTVSIIRTKRDGSVLTAEQIRWFIDGYTAGTVPDEQASALLMAIVWRGMSEPELAVWTQAMVDSGSRLNLSGIGRPTVDKHSTGGVGDKISLILCPLVAACGAAVPQLSGRGLGHTGGTLDKMEAIPGWCATRSPEQMRAQLHSVGAVICAAGEGLAPADRKLYALRDVTGTVESIPLIASSIMSKKIAEGTESLVLNVTVGSGAFMKRLDHARELATTMMAIGAAAGVRTSAVISAMDQPLGRTAGNGLEVTEAVDVLKGGGPADVIELTLVLAREMLWLAGLSHIDPAAVLADGRALSVWREMVRAQSGDPDAALPQATCVSVVPAVSSGYITWLDAFAVGMAAWRLGAGRAQKNDQVSSVAGVVCLAKVGDYVTAGEPILELHTDEIDKIAAARDTLDGAIHIDLVSTPASPIIIEIMRGPQDLLSPASNRQR
jgi:thymidine phosphorylase